MVAVSTMVFLWAAAEATVWPLMPDALLVPLAAIQPWKEWQLIPHAMAGCALGGFISYAAAMRPGALAILQRLPFVRAAMIQQCRVWLNSEGAAGVCRQPLSMVPFKIFAVVASDLRVPLMPFLTLGTLVRGVRFAIAYAGGSLVGEHFHAFIARFAIWCLAAWSVAFYAGMVAMTRRWETPEKSAHLAMCAEKQ